MDWKSHRSSKTKKRRIEYLPCLTLANSTWQKIIETTTSNIVYGGILKQVNSHDKIEYIIRFDLGKWTEVQKKYATLVHEILIIDNCVLKFLDDLYNQKFLKETEAQSVRYMFDKDIKHQASKIIFTRPQAQLAPFNFEIQYKRGVITPF